MRFRHIASAAAVAALLCATLVVAPASAATWRFETLDGNSTADGRVNGDAGANSSSVVWSGQPHVFYRDSSSGDLRQAWWTGTAWAFRTLDGDCPTPTCPDGRTDNYVADEVTAIVWNNEPHVFYHDDDLRHAWWTGTTWNYETLDGDRTADGRVDGFTGRYTAVTVFDGMPHVWYYDGTNGNLRHAWWGGTRWYFESLDGDRTADGRVNDDAGTYASVTVWNNEPHVFYFHETPGNLRHAWYVPAAGRWYFEVLDGNSTLDGRVVGDVGTHSAPIVWDGAPHVWYQNSGNGELRHAWWGGTQWFFESLDGSCSAATSPQFPVSQCTLTGKINGDVGSHNAVTVFGGMPHVWYHDGTNGNLRHAWWGGTQWYRETLDGNGGAGGRIDSSVGTYNSVIVWSAQPHVFHWDGTGPGGLDLRHAWYS